jgi:DMSO/TMAO reductase YedYZ molybdopterin-dependent catalytic subunit
VLVACKSGADGWRSAPAQVDRLRIPTKLGFKSAKNLQAIEVTNTYPGGLWEDQGYDWFSGS